MQIKGQIHSINYSLEYKLKRGDSSTQFVNFVNFTSLLLWWVTIGKSKDQRISRSRDGWRIEKKSVFHGCCAMCGSSASCESSAPICGSSIPEQQNLHPLAHDQVQETTTSIILMRIFKKGVVGRLNDNVMILIESFTTKLVWRN